VDATVRPRAAFGFARRARLSSGAHQVALLIIQLRPRRDVVAVAAAVPESPARLAGRWTSSTRSAGCDVSGRQLAHREPGGSARVSSDADAAVPDAPGPQARNPGHALKPMFGVDDRSAWRAARRPPA